MVVPHPTTRWHQCSTFENVLPFLSFSHRHHCYSSVMYIYSLLRLVIIVKPASWSVNCDGLPGAIATDIDGDGRLELVVSHGESAAQPLSVYRVNQVSMLVLSSILDSVGWSSISHPSLTHLPLLLLLMCKGLTNSWLRVIPRTKFGAFARGAKVVVYTKKSGPHTRIIDGGSGYLCEMEPVAHFGLGKITFKEPGQPFSRLNLLLCEAATSKFCIILTGLFLFDMFWNNILHFLNYCKIRY